MIEIKDIENRESLKEWLEALPEERQRPVALAIASRIALRVMPVFWCWTLTPEAKTQHVTALPLLRAGLTAYLSAKFPQDEIVRLAASISNDFPSTTIAKENYPAAYSKSAVALAAGTAAQTIRSVDMAADVADSADYAYDGNSIWLAIQRDCQVQEPEKLLTTPLWQGVVSPADQVWKTLKSEIQNNREDAESWDYWILWYEGRLRGSKPNWNLYKQISLIESPTWQAGPEVLAREIKFLEQPNHGTGTIYQVGQLSEIAEQLKVSEEKAGRLSVTLEGQEIALAKVAEESQGLADSLGKLENDSKTRFKRLTDIYQQKFETALSVFNEQQAVKAPVELWKAKQDEHDKKSTTAFRWFLAGLAAVAGSAALILFFVFSGADWVAQVLAPIGCDAVNNPELCKGFSFRGLLVTGTVLTILTLLLWLTRLRMKEYLSERHLALDARERQAFVQTYLGLVAEGDVSEEAKEQRALVYSALFRPSTDGIVKEDGGLDPSIAAAISKLLSK